MVRPVLLESGVCCLEMLTIPVLEPEAKCASGGPAPPPPARGSGSASVTVSAVGSRDHSVRDRIRAHLASVDRAASSRYLELLGTYIGHSYMYGTVPYSIEVAVRTVTYAHGRPARRTRTGTVQVADAA